MREERGLSAPEPCPWCDTTAFLLCREAATLQSYARGQLLAQIVCTNPAHNGVIEGPAVATPAPFISPLAETFNPEAITAWNTRSNPPQEERSDPLGLAAGDDNHKALVEIAREIDAEADNISPNNNVHPSGTMRNWATRIRDAAFQSRQEESR